MTTIIAVFSRLVLSRAAWRPARRLLVIGVVLTKFFLPSFKATAQPPLGPPPPLEERLIRGNYGYAYGIAAADVDGDGDHDLFSSDTTDDTTPEMVNGTLMWLENDGHGRFREHVIAAGEPGWFERLAAADVNADGRQDVVVVLNRAGSLVWFENPGGHAAAAWTRRVIIDEKLPGAYDVAVADFDGDGRLDVAASSWRRGRRFTWYRNPGDEGFAAEWPEHLVEGDLAETRTIRVADFNADGRPDLLGTASGGALVAWYENSLLASGELAWQRHLISTLPAPIHGEPVDMDHDGDIDVVMAHGMRDDLTPNGADHRIVWYENPGQPGGAAEWRLHEVGHLPCAFEAAAADLDGDGHRDIVATAWGGKGGIALFRNPGASQSAAWTVARLKGDWPNANQVIITDLDGDGRPDIAAEAERGANDLRWWKTLKP